MTDFTHLSRRAVLAGALGAGAVSLLAGCNSSSDQGGDGGGGGGDATKGELQVWGGVPAENGPNQMFAAFAKKYPDIKVTYTRYVNDDAGNVKVDTSLSGGVPIDVLVSYGSNVITKRATSGLFLDITDRVKGVKDFEQFTPDGGVNYVYDGKIYTIPAAATPTVVMLNQQMLQDKGITIPDGWTTEDFHDIAKELSASGVYGTFNTPDLARQELGPNYRYTDDGKRSNFANPAFAKTLQLNLDMIADKSAMPETEILAQKLQVYPQQVFLTGKVGMLLNEVYITRYISDTKSYPHSFKTVMKPLPVPEKGKQAWNMGAYGDFLSISKQCKNPEAAWTLIQWWMDEGAEYMVAGGRLPSMTGLSADTMLPLLLGKDADTLYDVESVKSSVFSPDVKIPLDTITTGAAEINNILTQLNQECLLGKLSVADWVKQATQQCDAAIKKDS